MLYYIIQVHPLLLQFVPQGTQPELFPSPDVNVSSSSFFFFFKVSPCNILYVSMVTLEKMDGSSCYAYHSEFYLVQVNTHTDFGDLMQQLDHRTDEGVIPKQEVTSLHNSKCKSHGVALRLTVP